jgi:4-carboxymuconolactone decarboxylase
MRVWRMAITATARNAMGREIPADVDPQSGCRLPLRRREDLDEAGKRAYDRVTTPGKTIVGLRGPAGIRLYSPKTNEPMNVITDYLRHEAAYGPIVREVAILTVAREMDSQFEWAAHEPEALKVGVPQAVIDTIKFRKGTDGLDEKNAAVIEFGRQIFRDHRVTSAAYARVRALFDPTTLVELVLLMGNYAATAALLTAFDMQVPDGKPLLPAKA